MLNGLNDIDSTNVFVASTNTTDVNKTTTFKTKSKPRPRPIKTKTVADKTYIRTQIIAPAMATNRWQTGSNTHR